MDLFDEFSQLILEFENKKIEYALCGELAMTVYAFPRATLDIDILIESKTLEKVKVIANKAGFTIDAGLTKFNKDTVQIYRAYEGLSGFG